MALIINTEREGYALDQISDTLTVGDLIAYLSDYDEDEPVYIGNDNHYTFGGIHAEDFEEIEEGEE